MKKWIKLVLSNIYDYSARLLGLTVVLFIFMTAICCFFQNTKPHYEEFYSKNFIVMEPENLTQTEKMYVNKLILKNKIIPADEVYGKTLSYYDSLISVLTIFITVIIALLGTLAFTSWFSLKGKVKNEVQEIKCGLREDISDEIQRVICSNFYRTWLTTEVFGKYITENKDKLFPDAAFSNATNIDINELTDDLLEKMKKNMEDNKKEIVIPADIKEEI